MLCGLSNLLRAFLIAFNEGERILILPLLAGSGLMLSCFEYFRTGDRLKLPRLHATVVAC